MFDRPTIRDIAVRTGFSGATVSLALRNHPRISAATRERVGRAAAEMGYVPDTVMAAIAAHRWRRHPARKGPVLAALVSGAGQDTAELTRCAARSGYGMEVLQPREEQSPAEIAGRLWRRGIQGVVVGQSLSPEFCRAFDWSRFAAVGWGEGQCRLPIDVVMPDHFAAVQEGWERARERGYRRIGLVLFNLPAELDTHDRCAAYWERQNASGPAVKLPILSVDSTDCPRDTAAYEAWYQRTAGWVRAWMRRYRPDAVLGFNIIFYWLVREAGFRIPEDVGFVNLWIYGEKLSETGLRIPLTEVSLRTIDWLDLLLRTGQRGPPAYPRTIRIEPVWQDGEWLPQKSLTARRRKGMK